MENIREKKKRVYLSAPISGYDIEERRAAFAEKEEWLKLAGYDVVSPMKNGLPSEAPTREHMRRDIELLLSCDAVFFMERWTHSKGCMTEFHVATAVGMDIFFEEAYAIDMKKGIKFK